MRESARLPCPAGESTAIMAVRAPRASPPAAPSPRRPALPRLERRRRPRSSPASRPLTPRRARSRLTRPPPPPRAAPAARARAAAAPRFRPREPKATIHFPISAKVDLRVGVVLSAERIKKKTSCSTFASTPATLALAGSSRDRGRLPARGAPWQAVWSSFATSPPRDFARASSSEGMLLTSRKMNPALVLRPKTPQHQKQGFHRIPSTPNFHDSSSDTERMKQVRSRDQHRDHQFLRRGAVCPPHLTRSRGARRVGAEIRFNRGESGCSCWRI